MIVIKENTRAKFKIQLLLPFFVGLTLSRLTQPIKLSVWNFIGRYIYINIYKISVDLEGFNFITAK